MATQIKHRRGTTSEHSTFTGSEAEITMDTTKDTLVVHDGSTAGGHELAKADGSNIAFGDNVKAKFGDSDDLQIYHDGSNSYINDTGTGNLIVSGSSQLKLSGATGDYFLGQNNGSSYIYYAGDLKLYTTSSGVDISGTASATALKVSGTEPTLFFSDTTTGHDDWKIYADWDKFNIQQYVGDATYTNRIMVDASGNVGIGNSAPTSKLDVSGTVTADGLTVENDTNGDTIATLNNSSSGSAAQATLYVTNGSNNADGLFAGVNGTNMTPAGGFVADGAAIGSGTGVSGGLSIMTRANADMRFYTNGHTDERMRIANNGDISFYEDTGTTAKFFWDASAESLGIGTSLPAKLLDITDSSSGESIPVVISNKDATAGTGQKVTLGFGLARNSGSFKPEAGTIEVGRELDWTNDDAKIDSYMAFSTYLNNSATEKMRIDSSGNLGLGVTPESWHGSWSALQLGPTGFVGSYQAGATDITALGSNVFSDGSYKYIETDQAAIYKQQNGEHIFDVAASGTADSAISWTNAMTIDNSGNVGIGCSPSGSLHLARSGGADAMLVLENTLGTAPFQIGQGNDNSLRFYENASEKMRIDASGNLLVGTTDSSVYNNSSNSTADNGINLNASGQLFAAKSGGVAAILNRTSSDGAILQFNKSGSAVGSIGSNGGDLYIGTGDATLKFDDASDRIAPRGAGGAQRDGAISLGSAGNRFKDLYLSGGVYLGGTGAANKLDDYEEGNWAPSIGAGITAVGTVTSSGTYTKIGRIVTLHGKISATTSLTVNGSNNVLCGTLPFVISGSHSFSFNLMNSSFGEIKPQGAWSQNLYSSNAMAATPNLYFSLTYATS